MKKPMVYEIWIGGSLPESCLDWFEGMEVSFDPENKRTSIGKLTDQAALIGLLNKIQSLNMTLISVERSSEE